MKKISTLLIFSFFLAVACQPEKDEAEKLKEKLSEKKNELKELQASIKDLEKEIAAKDPDFAVKSKKATLVTTIPVKNETFVHYIEVTGVVESDLNASVSSETMGRIEVVKVQEGNRVNKGKTIMVIDHEILSKNLEEIQTSYELAKTLFEKQQRLWDKKIGTEVQYLEAKNRKESLEQQIANIKAQINKAYVQAPFSGKIDEIYVKEGEMAQPGTQMFRMVSNSKMTITADVSENYVGRFNEGDKVKVFFPAYDEEYTSEILAVGEVINPENRTFNVEVTMPKVSFKTKPNMVTVLKLRDYMKEDAVIIPTYLIQSGNRGDYIADSTTNILMAKKVYVQRGASYKGNTVIKEGLSGNEKLIDEGFRGVADKGKIKVVKNGQV